MKPLDSIELSLCKSQAKLFEESVTKTEYSSLIFIRRFMLSNLAYSFDNKTFIFQSISLDESFDMLDLEFGKSSYGKIKYTQNEMFWIGYIYRCIAIKYNLSSKALYRLFSAKEIIKYYNIGHTLDPIDMAERMMESINYDFRSNYEKSLSLMRRLMFLEKLENIIGKEVNVLIDEPLKYIHKGRKHTLNYGHVKEFKTINGNYLNAYVIDVNKAIEEYKGKVIAIVEDKSDDENKIIVSNSTKRYTKQEIQKLINFQGKLIINNIIR